VSILFIVDLHIPLSTLLNGVVIDVKVSESLVISMKKPMALLEGVSKVVPLWRSFKHGPHGKTL
jgi:hypothetical protein